MSNYTKTTDFEAKDSLPTGDSGKIIRGAEFETEFDAISTAIATKADTAGPTFTGTLTFETISDGTIGVTAFVDEDNMASNSATLVPTQQSVKAYVDAVTTELQAQDLDFQADSGGALSIDLDSETMTFTGGTGITTTGLANDVTFAIDSTVTTLTGTQTLTNKTLTAPVISTISNTGTITLPTSTDTLVGRATTDTLTNKTLTSAVLNTGVSGTAVLDEDNMASNSATQLATQQSIKAYVDATVAATNELVEDTTPQLGGDLDTNGNDILFADNDKAVFGAGSDLQIYHNGSRSIITDQGTGALRISATNFELRNADDSNLYANGIDGGAFNLYHAGSAKLATTNTGVDITGTAKVSTSMMVGSTDAPARDLEIKTSNPHIRLTDTDGGYTEIFGGSGITTINADKGQNVAGSVLKLSVDATDGLTIDSSHNVSIPNGNLTLPDNSKAIFGAGADLEIFSDGTNGRISLNSASGNLRMLADEFQLANTGYTNFYLTTTAADAVRLFHGGNQKFETTSTGIDVTGTAVIETGSGNTYPTASTSADNLVISDKTASTPVGITIFSDNASQGNIFFGDENDADNGRIVYDHNGNANTMSFYANGAERLSVDSTGIDVTGTVTADGLTVESTGATFFNATVDAGTGLTTLKSTNNSTGGSLKIQTGGNDRLQISATGDISFYEDTGTTAKLFWDASAESLGIGTSSSANTVHVKTDTDGNGITIQRNSTTANTYGQLGFSASTNDAGTPNLWIRGYRGSSFTDNYMTFGTGSTAGSERMRIDSSGNVGIGTTSPDYNFHVTGTGDTIAAVTAGASSVAGLNLGNSTNKADGGIRYDNSADALIFRASNAEKVRIDSSGNLLVNQSSSTSPGFGNTTTGLCFSDSGRVFSSASGAGSSFNRNSSDGTVIDIRKDGTTVGSIQTFGGNLQISPATTFGVDAPTDIFLDSAGVTTFKTNGTENARIDASGNLLVGTTSTYSTSKMTLEYSSNTNFGITLRDSGTATTAGHFNFVKGGSVVGTIQSTSSATSYNTSSDQRLKDNIVDAPSASDDIDAIQVRSFDWKADGSHQKYGMVAQELQSVAPEAVTGDADSDDMMGVDYSKLVPMMMKEIQSLRARVAQLEGEN